MRFKSAHLLRAAAYAGLAFLHLPLLFIVVYAFNSDDGGYSFPLRGLTLRWFARAWEREDILQAISLSMGVAAMATGIAMVLGTMTAAALARFVPAPWIVTLVESDEIATIGVGEATIPMVRLFNQSLGIDEAEFIAATGGTFKLGIRFEGWGGFDDSYVHGFGLVGR